MGRRSPRIGVGSVRRKTSPAGFAIILSADGSVMDGMHRVVKATLAGHQDISAVQFEQDPEPDFVANAEATGLLCSSCGVVQRFWRLSLQLHRSLRTGHVVQRR